MNNVLRYSKDGGNSWVDIKLDTDSYELSAISNEIQRLMANNGDYDQNADNPYFITITANLSELKSIVHISNENYKIDFSVPNSIGSVLGFSNEIIGVGYNESPKYCKHHSSQFHSSKSRYHFGFIRERISQSYDLQFLS